MSVYNRRQWSPGLCVTIMRGTPWGNPFVIHRHGTREEVLEKFRAYATKRHAEDPTWLAPLVGRDLLCCCKPLACHGDIIEEILYGQRH